MIQKEDARGFVENWKQKTEENNDALEVMVRYLFVVYDYPYVNSKMQVEKDSGCTKGWKEFEVDENDEITVTLWSRNFFNTYSVNMREVNQMHLYEYLQRSVDEEVLKLARKIVQFNEEFFLAFGEFLARSEATKEDLLTILRTKLVVEPDKRRVTSIIPQLLLPDRYLEVGIEGGTMEKVDILDNNSSTVLWQLKTLYV